MNSQRIAIVGGGAAGFFAALSCADAGFKGEIVLLEKTAQFLSKVKISGGGRCNVTHACFNDREFTTRFPRGERALIGPFKQFQASDTVEWFEKHGVKLKTEPDGRMFPVTDSSQTIIDCLVNAAEKARVKLRPNAGVDRIAKKPNGGFELTLSNGDLLACNKLLLATGGCRSAALGDLASSLGHTLESPVPSLFTFHSETPWLKDLAGVSVETAEAWIPETKLRERGPVLVTHWGLSGPAILRLSAWGARLLHEKNYRFPLHINWLPDQTEASLTDEFQSRRQSQGARLLINVPVAPLPVRLWEQLVLAAGIAPNVRWSAFPRPAQLRLIQQLFQTALPVTGKSLNKDEFVTCGGVRLNEVN
ncbi:MAG TPA: aminoacetone oxidase family FAD-binding enzyme, partial [Desulfuromonadaceae bacterium]|nr:aminoacetone oxidase family FAD-binding enzyme [Desulfuromonadaceae bacterium]